MSNIENNDNIHSQEKISPDETTMNESSQEVIRDTNQEPVEEYNQGALKSLWQESKAAVQANKQLKERPKYKWGLIEVIATFVPLIITQVILSIVILIQVTGEAIAQNKTEDIQWITRRSTEVLLQPVFLLTSSLSMYGCWLLGMWLSTRFRGEKSFKKDFNLKFKWKDLWIGPLLGVGLFAFIQLFSLLMTKLGVNMDEASNSQTFSNQTGFWLYFFLLFLVPILGPFMEELFFRGFLLQALLRAFDKGQTPEPAGPIGAWFERNMYPIYMMYNQLMYWLYKARWFIAPVLSGVCFGLMHFQGGASLGQWMTVIVTGTLGIVLAIVVMKTQRLGTSILAHMSYNGIIAVITLLSMA